MELKTVLVANRRPLMTNSLLGPRPREDDSEDERATSIGQKRARKRDRTRRKVTDLDADRQKVVQLAYSHFKLIFITKDPWVPWSKADEYAIDAYEVACEELQYDPDELPPDDVALGLIKDRLGQLRCTMKTAARDCVPSQYGFKTGHPTEDTVNYNRELVQHLLSGADRPFSHIDPTNPTSICRNPIFADILTKTCGWFADKKGDGYQYSEYIVPGRPMQVLMAQLLVTVECAIDEWKTGTHKKVEFKETVYAEKYRAHLGWLVEWEKFTKSRSCADMQMQEDLLRELRGRASGDNDEATASRESEHVVYNFARFEDYTAAY
ncbi:hypothetical protein EVJ58_g9267 [Rhodofomes roseus]|uniref:DUF6532 domain-containing protein n=1 Tax=Rhodofomes roseus TaxID=34475 RepID=A0A4Y9XVI2_9APHY|nr:hypothetical protein EVJ58_g9267 [Rhodofomes roseus]